jgi:carbonic anhydrase
MGRWVGLLAEAREEVRSLVTEAEPALLARYAERASVLVSLRNLMTYPWIAERVAADRLALHGWYFDFTWGVLMAAESPHGPFRQIDAAGLPRAAVGGCHDRR